MALRKDVACTVLAARVHLYKLYYHRRAHSALTDLAHHTSLIGKLVFLGVSDKLVLVPFLALVVANDHRSRSRSAGRASEYLSALLTDNARVQRNSVLYLLDLVGLLHIRRCEHIIYRNISLVLFIGITRVVAIFREDIHRLQLCIVDLCALWQQIKLCKFGSFLRQIELNSITAAARNDAAVLVLCKHLYLEAVNTAMQVAVLVHGEFTHIGVGYRPRELPYHARR